MLQARFRDDVAAFTAAFAGGCLELFLVTVLLCDRRWGWVGMGSPLAFLALGQAFLLVACLAALAAARAFLGPLAGILHGIQQFRRGNLAHRIPASRVAEVDELASQLNRMAQELGTLDAMKDDFVTTVSHELRSPMAAVEGYARLLLDERGLSEEGGANLRRITANLARLRSLVENSLDLSRLGSGSMTLAPAPTDLRPIVAETAALFAEAMRARGVAWHSDPPPSLPRALGDPMRIRQVVTNLIDNAVKYNRRGGRVEARFRVSGGDVELLVGDRGPGIPPAEREKVFDKFRRLPQADPELAAVKGVGLGLPISRGLARLMGGDLLIEESGPEGTVFALRLPAAGAP